MRGYVNYARAGWLFLIAILCIDSADAQKNAAQIAALDEAALIEILQDGDASTFEKAKAAQRLAVVGTKTAVPALAELLADETLNVYARFGLEGIVDAAADEALRKATRTLQGRALIGVIDSLGQRHDAQAVPLLRELMNSRDQQIASAAIGALGNIGTVECAEALKAGLAKNAAAVGDACLASAEKLSAAGQETAAIDLYKAVAAADVAKHVRVAALDGQLRLLKGDAKELLVELIRSPDEELFRLALAAARRVPGVTEPLARQIDQLAPERQALLLRALGDRDEPIPLRRFRSATESKLPEVREAAIVVLAKRGDASVAGLLLDAALGGGEISKTARQGLETLAGAEVDEAITARLAPAKVEEKPILFELVAARRIAAAKPAVREALKSSDESIRLAAIAAFGQLADLDELDVLLERASNAAAGTEAAAAQAALRTAAQRMDDRERTAEVFAREVEQRDGETQTWLFDLLGQIGGPTALRTVVASAKSVDAATKDAATRVLGEWPNPDAADALLDIARNDREQKYRVRALRGFLRIARQLQLPEEERLEMYRTAMELATRDDERKLALDVLTRIPSSKTLALAVDKLDQAALKDTAADAAVKIAAKIITQQPNDVAGAMQKVLSSGVAGEPFSRAQQLLNQAQGRKQ